MNTIKTYWNATKRRLTQGVFLAMLALAPLMSAQAAATGVPVDQSPLILQQPVPPNIVLMLDDSGSMAWDFMPDANYIKPFTLDSLRNPFINFVYYNPNTTYQVPVMANGAHYPNASFPNAYINGFDSSQGSTDIRSYESPFINGFDYYTQLAVSGSSAAKENCSAGYDYYDYYGNDLCYKNNKDYYFINPCPSGGTYNPSTKMCSYTGYKNYFTYTSSSGVRHYVAKTGDCSIISSSLDRGNCTDSAAVQQNVANWFGYYRSRILTAKTGLTLAMSNLDPTYRFGYGSINGVNNDDLGGLAGKDSSGYATIAKVYPFGSAKDVTAKNARQRQDFWEWITSMKIGNDGTPLRKALQSVGDYYGSTTDQQPWNGTDATLNSDGTTTVKAVSSPYACRPAYAILTTDGFWNGGDPSGIGNSDGTDGNEITGPKNQPYTYTAQAPYSDSYSVTTLADVAMHYWKNDLQSGIDNEVPTTPNDPAFWQHMTTFTMGLGWDPTPLIRDQSGDANLTIPQVFDWARTGNPPSGSTLTSTSSIWPKPKADSINNIADLAHAAVNGHGDFFSVKSPDDLIDGLKSALAAIADRQGAGSAITNSSDTLPTTTSATDPFFRFRGTYYTGQWTGTLTAETYDTSTTTPSYKSAWSTDSLSASFSTVSGVSLSNRNVWTTTNGTGGNGSVAFRDASDLTSAQQTGLSAYSVSTVSDQTMLNYLLGDNTYAQGNPGGTLRARKALLGDIVSSTPVYVAEPDPNLYANATFAGMTGNNSYADFVSTESTRAPMVYVAANDGMLHAFRVKPGAGWERNGSTVNTVTDQPGGTEVYAYMPSAVLTQPAGSGSITNLANPQYGVVDAVSGTQPIPHQYYNDGRITVQNVYFSNAWHTVLVGTTGRGPAKAIYALDITDPTVLMNPATAKNALMWERSAGDGKTGSKYIGEMIGAPVIAQIKQGNKSSWAVFVGNGYNSVENKPALLQFDLQTGDLSVHQTTGSASNDGLAEPGLMQGSSADGISIYAFAGDLHGNLWKFDLSSATSAGSSVFKAVDSTGVAQPITSLVSLAYDGTTSSTFALFGTGKYLTQDDTKDPQVQTWYGVRVGMGADLAGTTSTATPVVTDSTARSDLTERYAFDDSSGNRATSLQEGTDMNGKAGWFMDLPQTGERIVNRTQFIGGKAVVSTLIPKVDDPCNTVPAGAVMGVDPFTGANQINNYGLGTTSISYKNANGTTVTKTVAINGKVFGAGPAAGVTAVHNADGTISISFNTIGGGLGTLGPISIPSAGGGRLSWRELTN